MNEDAELLRRYVELADEPAFAELVRRQVAFVHSAALRQVNGDIHLASDVTQLVFADLARKARAVMNYRVLAGWLFTSTRYAAAKIVRSEQRRRRREAEAHMQDELSQDPAARLDWARVRPVLDEVLGELGAVDREAILLRYFENRDFNDVGARLNLAANTARMRVERALEKLRGRLARRGMESTSAALAAILANEGVLAAPAGLAANIAGAALAGRAAIGSASLLASFMSMTKLQIGLAVAVTAGTGAGYLVQTRNTAALQAQIDSLRQESAAIPALRNENEQLTRQANEVVQLRAESGEFTRLGTETTELRARAQVVAQLQSSAAKPRAVYDVSALDAAPRAVSRTPPEYPMEMRRAGISGEVTVDFVIDQSGNVQQAKAVKSTHREFENSAVQAITMWKFEPGRKNGQTVDTHLQVPIVFQLTEEELENSGSPGAVN